MSNYINILMVTIGFPPAYPWGGPVRNVYHQSKGLIQRNHQVTVICTNLLDKRARLQDKTFSTKVDGINVTYFKTWNLPWWPGTFGPTWLPELGGFLQKNISQYDVVHLHGYRNFIGLQVIREARKAGIPYILQPHGELPVIVNTFLLKRLYDRWLGKAELEGMSALIALQSSEHEQAIERGGTPRKNRDHSEWN